MSEDYNPFVSTLQISKGYIQEGECLSCDYNYKADCSWGGCQIIKATEDDENE